MSIRPQPEHRAPSPGSAADIHRTLPHSLESERGLLGSMLIAPHEVVDDVARRITADAFYSPSHQTIFALLVEMWGKQHPADPVTLTQALRDRKQLDAVGGPPYITSLIDFTPTAANAGYYLDIVKEKHALRRIIAACADCARVAYDDREGGVADASEQIQRLLTGLAREASTGTEVTGMKDLVMGVVDDLIERHAGRGKLRGIASGIPKLDALTRGWQGGQMIVVAAPEKQGKSSFARQCVLEAARAGCPTAILTHEMGRKEVTESLLATLGRVDLRRVDDGTMNDADFAKVTKAAGELAELPIFIFDEADSSVLQFRANCRRAVKEFDCRLIVLDYLQLVAGSEGAENREERVSEVARNAKLAAMELDVPILVLSQLNKDGVTQYARAIQQHLDRLIVIEHEDPEAEGEGKAWIRVKLARGGPKGRAAVMWRPSITRFDPLTDERTVSRVEEL